LPLQKCNLTVLSKTEQNNELKGNNCKAVNCNKLMCNSYLVVLVLPLCILFSLQCRGVTDRSIAVGIVGMKVVLTSDLLPC